jgi:hypothetical protein
MPCPGRLKVPLSAREPECEIFRLDRGHRALGRKQDRARVAGGQDYEVRYDAKKPGKSKAKVKSAAKKAGATRKRVERTLGR